MPEPGIINPDAVLFFQPGKENGLVLDQIKAMKSSAEEWRKFSSQPRLLPGAEYFVIEKFNELQAKMERLCK